MKKLSVEAQAPIFVLLQSLLDFTYLLSTSFLCYVCSFWILAYCIEKGFNFSQITKSMWPDEEATFGPVVIYLREFTSIGLWL